MDTGTLGEIGSGRLDAPRVAKGKPLPLSLRHLGASIHWPLGANRRQNRSRGQRRYCLDMDGCDGPDGYAKSNAGERMLLADIKRDFYNLIYNKYPELDRP